MWFEGDNDVMIRVVYNHYNGENKLQAILCGELAVFTHKTIAKFVTKCGRSPWEDEMTEFYNPLFQGWPNFVIFAMGAIIPS